MSIDVNININPFMIVKLPCSLTQVKKSIRACSNPQCLYEPPKKDETALYCSLCGNKIVETFHDVDDVSVFNIVDFIEELFNDCDAFCLDRISKNSSTEEWLITPNSYDDGCFNKIKQYTTGFIDFSQYDYNMMIDRYFNRTKKWKTLTNALDEMKIEYQKSFGLVQRVS